MVSAKEHGVVVEREWTALGGVRIFLRDYAAGGGPPRLPVVCLHGLTRNSKDFDAVAPVIAAQGRRVITMDVRGRGRSDRSQNPRDYSPAIYAADTIGLLDALGIGKAIFLGTSMGGLISMFAALKRPSLCRALILNDVGPELDAAGVDRIRSYAGRTPVLQSWDEAGRHMQKIGGAAFPDYDLDQWITFARLNHREMNGEIVVDCDPRIAINLQRRQPPKFLMWHYFRKVARRRPSLLIRGELSDLISLPVARKMLQAAPQMEFVEVPRVGHAPILSEPAAKTAIRDFLSRNA